MSGSKSHGRQRPITRLAAMLGRTRIALLAGILTIGFAGCGGNDGTIPQSDSEQLLSLLTSLQDQLQTHNCAVAESLASNFDKAVNDLPDTVDPEVQDALDKGAEHLTELANDPSQCVDTGSTGVGGVETTDTTDTGSSTTSSTSTTTTTTETTSTPEENTPETPSTAGPGHETPPTGQGPQNGGNTGSPTSGGLEPPDGGKR
jgi:hypothetical protein